MANLEWVISDSNKMEFHTHLDQVIVPIRDELSKFKWLISDVEYMAKPKEPLPIDFEQEYFILSHTDFLKLADPGNHLQMIWGVLLAIPSETEIHITEECIPFADGNSEIWRSGNIQHPDAQIEIICFDSSYTLVKFRDENLSNKFKAYFPEAIELDKFS